MNRRRTKAPHYRLSLVRALAHDLSTHIHTRTARIAQPCTWYIAKHTRGWRVAGLSLMDKTAGDPRRLRLLYGLIRFDFFCMPLADEPTDPAVRPILWKTFICFIRQPRFTHEPRLSERWLASLQMPPIDQGSIAIRTRVFESFSL